MSEDNKLTEQQEEQAWSMVVELQKLETEEFGHYNFQAVYQELQDYFVKIPSIPTPGTITECLSQVQSFKDRVTQLLIVSNNVSSACKRTYQTAFENFYLTCTGTVAEREYKSKKQYRSQYNLYLKAEDCSLACKQVLDNLKSTQEVLSRQITIFQLELELGNVSRGSGNSSDDVWN